MGEIRTHSQPSSHAPGPEALRELAGPAIERRQNRSVSVTSPSLTRGFRYIDNPMFHEPGAWERLVESPLTKTSREPLSTRPLGLEDTLTPILRQPLLSQEAMRALFLKMNFLKFRAAQHVLSSPDHVLRPDQLAEVETLFAQSMEVRNTIVLSNTRLALKTATKYVAPEMTTDDLASHGFECLLKCVDFYDCAQPTAFSNYAITSLRRTYARALRASREPVSLVAIDDPEMPHPADTRSSEASGIARVGVIYGAVRAAVDRLSDKERAVVETYHLEEGTLQEAGDRIGVTREGARRIKLRAISRLKGLLGTDPTEELP